MPRCSTYANGLLQSSQQRSFEERVLRVTKRELLRSHRANPVLVESLLLGLQYTSNFLTIEIILDLCRYQQRMKWLCPWGVELIDETNRPPGCDIPEELFDTLRDIRGEKIWWEKMLTPEQIVLLLWDKNQHFDRIYFAEMFHPIFLTALRLHACEELHTNFFRMISSDLIQNIVRCKTLKIANFGGSHIRLEDISDFQSLPHLEQLCHGYGRHWMDPIKTLRFFPKINFLQIRHNNWVFTDEEMEELTSIISNLKDNLRYVRMECIPKRRLTQALGQCTKLNRIFLETAETFDHEDAEPLFGSPLLQQSVTSIYVHLTLISQDSYELMAKFTNLRCLRIGDPSPCTEDVDPIIRANAAHLCELALEYCDGVHNEILDTIASCRCLRKVTLKWTGVTADTIRRYEVERKPIWQVLVFHDRYSTPDIP